MPSVCKVFEIYIRNNQFYAIFTPQCLLQVGLGRERFYKLEIINRQTVGQILATEVTTLIHFLNKTRFVLELERMRKALSSRQ